MKRDPVLNKPRSPAGHIKRTDVGSRRNHSACSRGSQTQTMPCPAWKQAARQWEQAARKCRTVHNVDPRLIQELVDDSIKHQRAHMDLHERQWQYVDTFEKLCRRSKGCSLGLEDYIERLKAKRFAE